MWFKIIKERTRVLYFEILKLYFEEEKLLELSGSEYYVTPLVLDSKENIYFSFREILHGTCPIISCGEVTFISFLLIHTFA